MILYFQSMERERCLLENDLKVAMIVMSFHLTLMLFASFLFAKPRQNGTTNVCISACLWKCDLEKVDWVLCSGSSWQELDSAGPISTVHLPNMLSRD